MLVGLSACSLEVTGRSNLSYWSERMTFDRRNSMLCCGKGIVDSVGNERSNRTLDCRWWIRLGS